MSNEIDVMVVDPKEGPFIPSPSSTKRGVARYRQPGCGLIALFIVVAWGLEIFDHFPGVNLDGLGLRPRKISGLLGIFTMPWLHGGFGHLISNTIPFVVLGYLIVATERQRFYYTSFMILLLSGLGTWFIGDKNSIHIGASGLVYGYFGYLVTRAFLEKRALWTVLGILLLIVYGGMIWGVLPTDSRISWEGHLMGFLSGFWMARVNFKRQSQSAALIVNG